MSNTDDSEMIPPEEGHDHHVESQQAEAVTIPASPCVAAKGGENEGVEKPIVSPVDRYFAYSLITMWDLDFYIAYYVSFLLFDFF